jgi:hypothetical protein
MDDELLLSKGLPTPFVAVTSSISRYYFYFANFEVSNKTNRTFSASLEVLLNPFI